MWVEGETTAAGCTVGMKGETTAGCTVGMESRATALVVVRTADDTAGLAQYVARAQGWAAVVVVTRAVVLAAGGIAVLSPFFFSLTVADNGNGGALEL
jgi:hypothetical protein